MKAQIISGEFGDIIARQKSTTPIELGELLVVETPDAKIILTAFDMSYGSQIAQQHLELISGMHLEQNQKPQFFEEELRNYTLAHLKTVLSISKAGAKSAKQLPPFFSIAREITKEDLSFLPRNGFSLGKVRSGSKTVDMDVFIDTKLALSHHILIPATTGKGKSNLMSCLLWNLLPNVDCGMIVFDPHDEYVGRNGLGLKDHPSWRNYGSYYSSSRMQNNSLGAISLKIHLTHIRPSHFGGVSDFSGPQYELMSAYSSKFGERWIEALILGEKIDYDFNEGTIGVVKRRLCRLLDVKVVEGKIECNGIYSNTAGQTTLADVISGVLANKTVIVDTSSLQGDSELLLCSVITRYVFDQYKYLQKQGTARPVCSIVLEEAPRVLGKDVLERGPNVFSSIAREGRKFGVGLIAITQLPSMIPKDILANMNTKIILGLELASERLAIIESAAQDLSDENRAIASLDKGEAIVTSNFTRFAIPIAIPLFKTVVDEKKSSTTTIKLPGIN